MPAPAAALLLHLCAEGLGASPVTARRGRGDPGLLVARGCGCRLALAYLGIPDLASRVGDSGVDPSHPN